MQKTYRRRYAVAVAGMLYGFGTPPRVRSIVNSADSLTDTWDIPVPAPVDATTYEVTVNGIIASVTTDFAGGIGATQEALTTALLDAIRQSPIYDIVSPTADLGSFTLQLVSREPGVALTVTGTNLTPANAIAAAVSGSVPFGTFVGRQAADPEGTGRLMTTALDVPIGIALATHAIEKNGSYDLAVTEYQPDEVMDVVDAVNSNEGVWMKCAVASVSEGDTVYASYAPATRGFVTNVATNAVAVGQASFRSAVEVDPNGENIVLVIINKP